MAFVLPALGYRTLPRKMGDLADRVGRVKAARASCDAYLEKLKAILAKSGEDEAEGKLFRVTLTAETRTGPFGCPLG